MEIDDAISSVGDFGRGQLLIFLCICLVSQVPASWHVFAITFIGATPSHHCTIPSTSEDLSLEDSFHADEASCLQYVKTEGQSNSTVPCENGWTYSDTPYGTTIVTEVRGKSIKFLKLLSAHLVDCERG